VRHDIERAAPRVKTVYADAMRWPLAWGGVMALAAAAAPAPARAHVGAQIAVARFTSPAEPDVTNDPPPPYSFVQADGQLTITWDDGDSDPTGRFTFYRLDTRPTFQVATADVERLGTRIADAVNDAGGYFVSCSCTSGPGVVCPPVTRDPAGNCRNSLVWDTSQLAAGTYWIAAVNDDPPTHTVNVGAGPVRVAHGAQAAPPAAVIVRPDGVGSWTDAYDLSWLAAGTPPLTFALWYGTEDGDPLRADGVIAANAAATLDGDGRTWRYRWDLAGLADARYFVRLRVTDGNGAATTLDSYYSINLYHQAPAPPADMSMATLPDHHGGCSLADGAASDTPASRRRRLPWALLLFLLPIFGWALRRSGIRPRDPPKASDRSVE
jgi:hypothetical protein